MEESIRSKYRTVLSGSETEMNALSLFGHATNSKAELPLIDHYHKDKLEFVIMVKGVQKYTAGGKEYTLYGGEVFFTAPNEIHSSGESPQAVNEILWFQIDLSSKENFLNLQGVQANRLYKRIADFNLRRMTLTKKIVEDFLESFELLCRDDVFDKIKGGTLFVYSLIEMLDSQKNSRVMSEDILAARQYIIENVKEQITMYELLRESGLSATRFKEKFKEQTGLSPREYINSQKIEKARFDVAFTKASITDIAFDYSFSSSNYFTKVFKQFTGYSPKEYRKKYLKGKIEI